MEDKYPTPMMVPLRPKKVLVVLVEAPGDKAPLNRSVVQLSASYPLALAMALDEAKADCPEHVVYASCICPPCEGVRPVVGEMQIVNDNRNKEVMYFPAQGYVIQKVKTDYAF